jgi:hypothetical protein
VPEPMLLLSKTIELLFLLGPISWLHSLLVRVLENVYADPLSAIAIVLGAVGIWRAEQLFQRLDKNLENLIGDMKNRALDEAVTVSASYAAFGRALQAVKLDPHEMPADSAFALLTAFRFQTLRYPNAKPEVLAKLRKDTRESTEKAAHGYVEMLVQSKLGKLRDGITLADMSD